MWSTAPLSTDQRNDTETTSHDVDSAGRLTVCENSGYQLLLGDCGNEMHLRWWATIALKNQEDVPPWAACGFHNGGYYHHQESRDLRHGDDPTCVCE